MMVSALKNAANQMRQTQKHSQLKMNHTSNKQSEQTLFNGATVVTSVK